MSDRRLEIHIHWLNGWFETLAEFDFGGDEVLISTRKTRLDTRAPYISGSAAAKRVNG